MTDVLHEPQAAGTPTDRVDAVVVGAGFAGMYMLHRFRGLGVTTRVFEAGGDVGGTWYWNRYPGARCDVASINYSYSFDPELEQEWNWSERYSPQPEILEYAQHVADRYDLRRDIQFNTRVEAATFDEGEGRWTITTDAGDVVSAQHFIMAVGCLSASKLPEIPGIEDFGGETYHTGHWPHEGVDFSGKRVAVIGTGSSAIQSIPIIAEQAAHLTVFQRTPNFSFPAHNRPLTPDEVEEVKAIYPDHREAARRSGFGVPAVLPDTSALSTPEEVRQARYEEAWKQGDLVSVLLAYDDLLTVKEANDTAAEFVRNKIRSIVTDPEVAEILAPTNHPVGTKRPCLDSGYFETFNRDDVELVDLLKTPLEAVTPTGIRTSGGEYEVDAIVFATGFDAMTGSLLAVDIKGRDGESLRDKWAAGPRTYLGLLSAGFPNLFMITGPGSPSVLSNMMVSIEQHVDFVAECVNYLREHDKAVIEPTLEAEDAWVEHVNEAGDATLYPQANSWYMGANVPGKPRVFMPYIGGVGVYREKCEEVVANGYEGFELRP
jgi:cation diffusion facilitator CzcD-associated flavoprotein CzcO